MPVYLTDVKTHIFKDGTIRNGVLKKVKQNKEGKLYLVILKDTGEYGTYHPENPNIFVNQELTLEQMEEIAKQVGVTGITEK